MFDLETLKPKAHPLKAELQKHKISCGMVRKYLGLSYPYVSNMLNGQFSMPEKHEKRIKALIYTLEMEE